MKKLETLSKIIQVKSHALNARQKFVGKLRKRLGDMEEEIREYHLSLDQERDAASKTPHGMIDYTNYASMIGEKVKRLQKFKREAEAQLAKEQEKLKVLYADLRVHQKILDEGKQKYQAEIDRKEQNSLDDLFSGKKKDNSFFGG